ncbi:hypothetical protein M2332_001617 [Sphingobium sp. B11D3A]|nr:hypothetical protein [Sphingobium sp. B11D3A]
MDDLPEPSMQYRPDIAGDCSRFETPEECRQTDYSRAVSLIKTAKRHPHEVNPRAAIRLARILQENCEGTPTLASRRFMRDTRIRVCGALWQFIASEGMTARVATIAPKSWRLSPDALVTQAPERLLSRVRSDLYKVGANSKDCWMIGILHGEYERSSQTFLPHLHLAANPKMIEMIDRLRSLPNYSGSPIHDEAQTRVHHPIQVKRKPLTNLPVPLTYLAKSYWPARTQFKSASGKYQISTVKQKIPEPYHSMLLLWLDQWTMDDVTLLIGLRTSKAGLIRTSR